MLKAWSYSRLTIYEQCNFRAKLAYVDRIPEPPRALPPGKTEHANDRGTRVHEAAEIYVNSNIELIPELAAFSKEFLKLREFYRKGKVSLEGDWAFDADWNPVSWTSENAWARIKLDAFVRLNDRHGVVIDHKTGRLRGNEFKHMEQGQVYQLAAFLRYPELETIDVEFWYLDLDEITQVRYSRKQGLRFLASYTDRGNKMLADTIFKPNPNVYSCRFCPYGPKGTQHCLVGAQ